MYSIKTSEVLQQIGMCSDLITRIQDKGTSSRWEQIPSKCGTVQTLWNGTNKSKLHSWRN